MTREQQQKKHTLAIAAIIAVGLVLAALILTMRPVAVEGGEGHAEHAEEVDHGGKAHHEEAEPAKGAHGGKLFADGDFSLEVTIFEQNVPPHFRIYTYQGGKPIAPAAGTVTATVSRLGAPPQVISFTPEADYMKGNATLEEPHSFKVNVQAAHAGRQHRFAYEQIEARVTMSEVQVMQNGIDIHTSGPASIKSVLKMMGEISLNADRSVQVAPRFAGVVESVAANAGDKVRKGQVLAVLSSQSLAADRSDLRAAEQRLELARTVFQREQSLWREKITAEQDYLQARAALKEAEIAVQGARQRLAAIGAPASGAGRHEIRAPIDGIVTDKNIAAGASVGAEAVVFVVSDLSTVWAEMQAGEKDVAAIRTGQAALVLSGSTEARANGKVSFISPLVGEQTRTAKVRVLLPNADGVWRPGAPVRIEVVSAEVTVPVAVLAEAVQTVRDEPAVFGRYGDQFEARPIKTGRSDGMYVEVVDGLQAGVKYAAKNSFLIKADIGKSGASHDH